MKCTKSYNARAQLLLCSLNFLFDDVPVAVAVVVILNSLLLKLPNFPIREVKFDVYGKQQTAKIKLLPSVFSSLYSRIKIFVLAVNSKRHFSIFV